MTNKQARRELVSNILQSTAEYFNVEWRMSGHGPRANPDVISLSKIFSQFNNATCQKILRRTFLHNFSWDEVLMKWENRNNTSVPLFFDDFP